MRARVGEIAEMLELSDILIAACARRHGAELETTDADFALLRSV